MSRPPSPITRAAARAPRNAPVRFTSMTSRQSSGGVSSGPATIGEIPALQIQTSMPPHSDAVASATASLNSATVTSPQNSSVGPGSSAATELMSRWVRATSATLAPAREKACASSSPSPRPAPVSTTRPPLMSPTTGNDSGISIRPSIGLPPELYRSVQYTSRGPPPTVTVAVLARRSPRDAPPDAADPRVRGARDRPLPPGGGAGLRPPVDRPGSLRRRRLLASPVGRRDHVDPSRSRALPGKGAGSPRHVRGADGQGAGHQPRSWRLDAHRRPQHRDLRRQRHRRRRPPHSGRRGGGVPAPSRRRDRGRLLRRRRSGTGRLPRGREPRRAVAAAGGVLV